MSIDRCHGMSVATDPVPEVLIFAVAIECPTCRERITTWLRMGDRYTHG